MDLKKLERVYKKADVRVQKYADHLVETCCEEIKATKFLGSITVDVKYKNSLECLAKYWEWDRTAVLDAIRSGLEPESELEIESTEVRQDIVWVLQIGKGMYHEELLTLLEKVDYRIPNYYQIFSLNKGQLDNFCWDKTKCLQVPIITSWENNRYYPLFLKTNSTTDLKNETWQLYFRESPEDPYYSKDSCVMVTRK